jgi:hypothetical protein
MVIEPEIKLAVLNFDGTSDQVAGAISQLRDAGYVIATRAAMVGGETFGTCYCDAEGS